MTINLDYYKIFYQVAICGNITRASEKLFISQPAISQTIAKLEEALGVTLFIRSKKGVKLTIVGEKIFKVVKNGLDNLENVQKIALEQEHLLSGELTLSCGSNIAKKLLLKSIKEFSEKYPLISINIENYPLDISCQKLQDGKLDLVIGQFNSEVTLLSFTHLSYEKYVFVSTKEVNFEKVILMDKGTYSRKLFDNFLANYGHDKVKHEIVVNGYSIAIELCKMGLGVIIAPFYLVEKLLDSGELVLLEQKSFNENQNFGYYINPENVTNITKEFLQILKKNNLVDR